MPNVWQGVGGDCWIPLTVVRMRQGKAAKEHDNSEEWQRSVGNNGKRRGWQKERMARGEDGGRETMETTTMARRQGVGMGTVEIRG